LFACGPADATAIPKPHHLLSDLNSDWFYLSGTGLPRLSLKRGRKTGVVVVVVRLCHVLGVQRYGLLLQIQRGLSLCLSVDHNCELC